MRVRSASSITIFPLWSTSYRTLPAWIVHNICKLIVYSHSCTASCPSPSPDLQYIVGKCTRLKWIFRWSEATTKKTLIFRPAHNSPSSSTDYKLLFQFVRRVVGSGKYVNTTLIYLLRGRRREEISEPTINWHAKRGNANCLQFVWLWSGIIIIFHLQCDQQLFQ